MPGPLTSSRRRARYRRRVAAGVLALATAAGCAACASEPDRAGVSTAAAPGSAGMPGVTGGPGGPGSGAATAETAAVAGLLRRRAAAVLDGDESAYTATVAQPSAVAGRRQLDSWAAARALRVSRLEVGEPLLVPVAPAGDEVSASRTGTGTTGTRATGAGTDRLQATVEVRYRVDDLDRGDRVARLQYDLVRSDGGWQVESERPIGPGATAPWVAMPRLRVERGEHAVVAGTAPEPRLAEAVSVGDRGLPVLRRQWAGTPSRVLVLAPGTAAEADALLGRSPGSGGAPVAATTEGPTGPRGTATGDRVVLDPTAFDRLTATGREVVLTHELTHVAVRATVPGRTAAWLTEGYADHVGYARADVPTRRLVAPLVSAIRTGHGPRQLPGAADLRPASGDIEVPYLAAWQAVEVVAAEHGEATLRRLVVAGSSTGSDADAEAATDRALVDLLGTTREQLTRAWLDRLGRLASAG